MATSFELDKYCNLDPGCKVHIPGLRGLSLSVPQLRILGLALHFTCKTARIVSTQSFCTRYWHSDDTEIWHGVIKNLKIHIKPSIKLKTWILLFSPLLAVKERGKGGSGKRRWERRKNIHCPDITNVTSSFFSPCLRLPLKSKKDEAMKWWYCLVCAKSSLLCTHRLWYRVTKILRSTLWGIKFPVRKKGNVLF